MAATVNFLLLSAQVYRTSEHCRHTSTYIYMCTGSHGQWAKSQAHVSSINLECLECSNAKKHVYNSGKVAVKCANETLLCFIKKRGRVYLNRLHYCYDTLITLLHGPPHFHYKDLFQKTCSASLQLLFSVITIFTLFLVSRNSNSSLRTRMGTRKHLPIFHSYLLSTGVEEITQSDNVTMIQLSHNLELSVLKRKKRRNAND